MLLKELIDKTEDIFNNDLVIPEPNILWKDKLLALKEANLPAHESSLIFDMRREQAKQMGFEELISSQAVEMLMGEPATDSEDGGKERQIYEWAYDHHKNKPLNGQWGGIPSDFFRMERKGLWYLPPFALIEKWRCRFGKLNYLKRDIPYGVVLKMLEIKKINLFNVFNVIAPMEAWERKTDIDPIIMASIWELPKKDKKDKEYVNAGQVAHFFVAQW